MDDLQGLGLQVALGVRVRDLALYGLGTVGFGVWAERLNHLRLRD